MWSYTVAWPMRMPARALGSRYGALLMLSIPPATMICALPAMIESWASIVAFIADPHIFETVVQWVDKGKPALIAAWRAGAWPCPAKRQLPKTTSSTSPGPIPERSTAALIATAPRSEAASEAKSPISPPMGVLATPVMTMGSFCMGKSLSQIWRRASRGSSREESGGCLRLRWRLRSRGFAHAPWTPYQLAAAIRADSIELIGAGCAERGLVAADVGCVVVGPERPRAALTAFAHFECHRQASLFRLIEQLPANQHPANLRRSLSMWPRPPLPRLNIRSAHVSLVRSPPERYFVSLKSSRPISIRRISDVPAPISYNLASRHSRPVAYSLM